MKIYVVTAGDHEAYHIIHATTDLKVAEAIKQKFNSKWDEPRIEVFENAENMLIPAWDVLFSESGVIESVTNRSDSESAYENINAVRSVNGNANRVMVTVQATTAWDAITIAEDKRAEYLAKKEG